MNQEKEQKVVRHARIWATGSVIGLAVGALAVMIIAGQGRATIDTDLDPVAAEPDAKVSTGVGAGDDMGPDNDLPSALRAFARKFGLKPGTANERAVVVDTYLRSLDQDAIKAISGDIIRDAVLEVDMFEPYNNDRNHGADITWDQGGYQKFVDYVVENVTGGRDISPEVAIEGFSYALLHYLLTDETTGPILLNMPSKIIVSEFLHGYQITVASEVAPGQHMSTNVHCERIIPNAKNLATFFSMPLAEQERWLSETDSPGNQPE